jgi:putative methyltransferase (TIGR04325 family)
LLRQGHPSRFLGDYASWDEARAASTGYDSELILEKTRQAALAVRDGHAAYERDSVLFDEPEYRWPLAAGLLRAAALEGGTLDVLDFGGALGSTYFQHRALFSGLNLLRWNIVEQPAHVRVGRELFQTEQLRFCESIRECAAESEPNTVILGSVLHYLRNPRATLGELAALPARHFIIDRTPFIDSPEDRLCVQRVDPYIYEASYPCWLFSRRRFADTLEELGLRVLTTFPAFDAIPGPVPVTYLGMILERRDGPLRHSASGDGEQG